jgi:hypothetical protein
MSIANIFFPEHSVVRPRLNCLEQDDPQLVETVRQQMLDPPSILPYNFQVQQADFIF